MADLDAVDEAPRRAAPAPPPPKCPFLDTVNRQILDFDLPKVCSVTLAKHHVYGCLVCGKYFAGRGRHTQAYTHSVQAGHHVFINLHDQRVYCLPDLYEVTDASLDDVRFALNPTFGTPEAVRAVDGNTNLSTDILGVSYLPGFIGLNNLKSTDFLNVVVQLLAHVHPLRNYFLDPANYAHASSPLVRCFGELVRKIWSPAAFKGTVSPLEFITEVSVASKLRFSVGHPADALDLLAWLLNTLHADLAAPVLGAAATAASAAAAAEAGGGAGSKRAREDAAAVASASAAGGFTRSIITEVFQGELEVTTLVNEAADAEGGAAAGGAGAAPKPRLLPFLFLSLDLPPSPLFKDDTGGRVIQNVPLHTLLGKFDGVTVTSTLKGQCLEHRRYRVTRLPPYLALHVKRFAKNAFFSEKNPTIVNFPVKNLELRPYTAGPPPLLLGGRRVALPSPEAVAAMPVAQLRALLAALHAPPPPAGALEKAELVALAQAAAAVAGGTKYDLVASIVHDLPPDTSERRSGASADPIATGSYRVHVMHEAAGTWYELQDLHVQETLPQLIGLTEAYILVYKRHGLPPPPVAFTPDGRPREA